MGIPKGIKIYDNKGKTFDRYTVVAGSDVYGMSEDQTPQGFNMYIGTTDEVDLTDNPAIGKARKTLTPGLLKGLQLREII